MYNRDEIDLYTDYYLQQAGGGFDIYSGAPYVRGYGIGSFLGGLWRVVMPLIKKGSIHVGREMAKSASNVFQDLGQDIDFKTSAKQRGLESLENIRKRAFGEMGGTGYNSRKRRARSQSCRKPPAKRTKRKLSKAKRKVANKSIKKRKKRKQTKNTKRTKKSDIFC